ncbi:MAG: response regulator, partial [Rhodoferax sp.]
MQDPAMTPMPDASAALQRSSRKVRGLLRRLSWGVPAFGLLLIVVMAGAFYQWRAKPAALANAQIAQREAAEHMASRVDALAAQIDRIVLTMRDWTQEGVLGLDDAATLNRVMIPAITQRTIVSSVHLANDEGREILLLKVPEGWKNRVTHVPKSGKQQHWLAWKDARTRIGEEWKEQDYDPRKRPWFTGVMTAPENTVYWTAPYLFQTTQEPGITAAVRWTDAGNGRQWVVAFDVLLSDLTRLTLDMDYARHGHVTLLTPDGKVLGLPRNNGFDQPDAVKKAVMQEPGAIGLSVLASALKAAANDPSPLGIRVPVADGFWRVKLLPQPLRNQEFRLALSAPESDFAPWSRRFSIAMALGLLTLTVCGAVLAMRLYRKVAEPVSALFEQLAAGNQELAAQGSRATAIAELSTALQKAQNFPELGTALLTGLATRLALGQGSLYLADTVNQRLVLSSGYARQGDPTLAPAIAYGEGLVGQCALEQRLIRLDNPVADPVRVDSALARAKPRTILIQPVMNNGVLLGIVELALLEAFCDDDQALLDSLLPMLALCMEILERNQRTQGLLLATQQQADELAAQQKLIAENEARLTQLLEDSPSAVTMVDMDGHVVFANRRLADMLGVTLEQLKRRKGSEFWASIEERDAFLQQFRTEGRVDDYEARFRDSKGKEIWVLLNARWTQQGDQRLLLNWMYEITERKQAELEIRKARQLAEEATKAKSDFLANMSHEIRTPMNAIIGMSHLALQTNLDKKQRNYIEKVHRSGENLLGIINDILDFSKIEAGKMSMETIDFRLEDVMDNLANLVGMKAEDKGLELLFNAAADVPTALQGDPLRLGQILINLGNNAVKFTDKGEIVVGIDKVSEDDTGVELHFWVKDSGIGMTPEQCSKMFQSFSQADASTTRKYGGTGLGLAISKNLVEAMQGRIWVESEPGKGSTFHFHARFGLQLEPMPRRMFKAEELLGVRVLVVDDNASAREILSTMARNFGLEVDVAWDGQQALQMVAAADKQGLHYDLVLMDWKMPVLDGVETVRQLQTEQLQQVPTVIMVTAYGREEALGSAQQRGVALQSVLTKPVTSSTLLEAIGEALNKGFITDTRANEKAGNHSEIMARLAGARVLLVEDNEMNQELALELLRNAGMEVVLANHGQQALDILANDPHFDGILMDCQMPVMDGYAATRAIRQNPAFRDLPIIAMTANAMAGDREKVLEAGMWDHIAKPLSVDEMFATIAKWIKPENAIESIATSLTSTRAEGQNDAKPLGAAARAGAGLTPLPGIDTRAGLATSMGNEKLYTRLLTKFLHSQADFATLFAAARADADPTAAARAAHNLKGTAGNIGAKGVQAAAAELEHACEAVELDEARIDDLLQRALQALAPVVQGLRAFASQSAAPELPAPQASASGDVAVALDRLETLLRDSNVEASDALEVVLQRAKGTPLEHNLQQVAAAVESFDFDAAVAALQQARGQA